MSTYVIGDVQGCWAQAQQLLDAIALKEPAARLIFAGDLVNRGPQSLATLRGVRAHAHAEAVLGNHDLHLLALAHGIRRPHRSDTLTEILQAPDRDELLDWLRRRPLALLEQQHLIVHAGVLPQWTAAQTMALAAEVEAVLRGPDWVDFLREMYGNTPERWHEGLRGVARLRCIVNGLTRVRFCRADGSMDLSIKDAAADAAPPGLLPWFEMPGRKSGDVTVVFGHWSTQGLTLRPDAIGLDTGCVWGGQLSAVNLETRAIVQVDCPQQQKPGKDVP